jgi:hypothetical protein
MNGLALDGRTAIPAKHGPFEWPGVADFIEVRFQQIEAIARRMRSIDSLGPLGAGFPVIIEGNDPGIAQMSGEFCGKRGFAAAARAADPNQNGPGQSLACLAQQGQGGGTSKAIDSRDRHRVTIAVVLKPTKRVVPIPRKT